MITAVDTNILLDILLPNEKFFDRSQKALETAPATGSLVICDLVYAELCVHFESQAICDEFLGDVGIQTEALSRPASFLASRVWRRYRQQGGPRVRILADFLIGPTPRCRPRDCSPAIAGFIAGCFQRCT
jgi:predicted nucleic acid-binding protein